jgi:nitroreductase
MQLTKDRPVVTPEALVRSLESRYAVKKYDKEGKIEPAQWEALLLSLVLAPSSYGFQPWKFVVVENPGLRAKLREASWGQTQVTDADKLVVFAARKGFGKEDVRRYIERIAEVRQVSVESLAGFKDMLLAAINRPQEQTDAWMARQVYIALGMLLTSAAALGVDATPMEGFEPAKYDQLLGLEKAGYTAVVVAALGHRAPDDAYGKLPKVRYARESVVEVQ